MILHWPQITYLILTLIGFIGAGIKLERTKNTIDFFASIISTFIILFILYCGGFFG